MTEHHKEVDEHSGIETTGHTWDGIKELNNPLPRWWLFIFYATVVWAIFYMVMMPAIPALPGTGMTNTPGIRGQSDRSNVAAEMKALKSERQANAQRLAGATPQQIESDLDLQQFALAMGESAFGDNCATCHGAGGRGAKGYPMLADDIWLWDGTLNGIEATIRHGIRHAQDEMTRNSAMPAFGRDGILTSTQIEDLTAHVLRISGHKADQASAARGSVLFAQHCVSCHGQDGKGMRSVGAPNLTDEEWQFGGTPAGIEATIYNARNAHMPAWQDRLDDTTIKALAVYVHSLGGGE
jgi:cytochrome c oxidase cbb3-type subunit 3